MLNKKAQVLTGPPAPTEPNSAGFNRACPICGWESEETIEGCSTKFAKCPKCGADFDQPFIINTQPGELELLTPQVAKEKNMKAQMVQTDINKDAIIEMLTNQGIDPAVAQQAAELIQKTTQETQNTQAPTQPQTPMQPLTPMKPVSNRLAAVLKKSWGDEPGRINFEPGYKPPTLAEADEQEEIDMFHADEDEEEQEGENREISSEEAHELGEKIGINWEDVEFTSEALAQGYKVELEHGKINEETNITDDDPEKTAKIAWAHLNEMADYYTKLKKMEGDKEQPEHEVLAMRIAAVTLREVQEVILPQIEEDLFQIDVALQNNDLSGARAVLNTTAARFATVKTKIDNLGDVEPTVFSPQKETSFLSKIGL